MTATTEPITTEHEAPAPVDRAAWHHMMAHAYECMDEIEAAVGSEKCPHCGEWHPIPKYWPRRDESGEKP